jgi:hypothetical protein
MSQRTITTEGTASPKDFGLLWRPFAKWQTKPIFNSKNDNNSKGVLNKVFGGYKPNKNNISETKTTTEVSETSKKSFSINTKSYNKNQNYEYNILNTPNKSSSKIL